MAFWKCFSPRKLILLFADAFINIYGTENFPEGEELKAGDYQYRIYEQGVKKEVGSGADDLMKAISVQKPTGDYKLSIPFTMPEKQATGEYTVSFLAKDQDKIYDLCIELNYNYTF